MPHAYRPACPDCPIVRTGVRLNAAAGEAGSTVAANATTTTTDRRNLVQARISRFPSQGVPRSPRGVPLPTTQTLRRPMSSAPGTNGPSGDLPRHGRARTPEGPGVYPLARSPLRCNDLPTDRDVDRGTMPPAH